MIDSTSKPTKRRARRKPLTKETRKKLNEIENRPQPVHLRDGLALVATERIHVLFESTADFGKEWAKLGGPTSSTGVRFRLCDGARPITPDHVASLSIALGFSTSKRHLAVFAELCAVASLLRKLEKLELRQKLLLGLKAQLQVNRQGAVSRELQASLRRRSLELKKVLLTARSKPKS